MVHERGRNPSHWKSKGVPRQPYLPIWRQSVLCAVAVMALGCSQVVFLPAQKRLQGTVGAVQRVGGQVQCCCGSVGAGLGL